MEIKLMIQCMIVGILGQLVSIFSSMEVLEKKATSNGVSFSYKKFFESEFPTIIKSCIALIIFTMGFDQLIHKWPVLASFSMWIFPVVGFGGDKLIFRYLSKTNKWLDCKIDEQTNIDDAKTDTSPAAP